MTRTSLRLKYFLFFLVLYLSWTATCVLSAAAGKKMKVPSDEEEGDLVRREPSPGARPFGAREAEESDLIRQIAEPVQGRRGDHKRRHFDKCADYEAFYAHAQLGFEKPISHAPVQLVDEFGNFMTVPRIEGPEEGQEKGRKVLLGDADTERSHKALAELLAAMKDIDPKGYRVVAVFGHQSTGKSYLMNAVFGTKFGEKGHRNTQQMTRGVWMARSPVIDNLLVIDCEGTGGGESIKAVGREAEIAEFGMLYTMLVSQVVIFNLDAVHLNTKEHMAMFIKTLDSYLKNKLPGAPRLRIIMSIRNILSDKSVATSKNTALALVTEAYKLNQKEGDEGWESVFDLRFFWFGMFSLEPLQMEPSLIGYDDPEFFEEHDVTKEIVKPFFHDRLALFKDRFLNDQNPNCYLKDLEYTVIAPRFPAFLHRFWDSINSQDVGMQNVLAMSTNSVLREEVDRLSEKCQRKFTRFIANHHLEAPEAVKKLLDALIRQVQEGFPAILAQLAPAYDKGRLLAPHKVKLLERIDKIIRESLKELMFKMANAAAGPLDVQVGELLAAQETHEAEVAALRHFDIYRASLKKLCPEDLCPSAQWQGELMRAQLAREEQVRARGDARIQHDIDRGLGGVDDEQYGGDILAGIQDLAHGIADREGRPRFDMENLVARAYHARLSSHGDRAERVRSVLRDQYRDRTHDAQNEVHLNEVGAQATAKKAQLLAFRNHFEGRVGFSAPLAEWDSALTSLIDDFKVSKREARDARLAVKEAELARLHASHKEASLTYALGIVMLYLAVIDFSGLTLLLLSTIFVLAVSGKLGPQTLDRDVLLSLPGMLFQFALSLPAFVARTASSLAFGSQLLGGAAAIEAEREE